MQLNLIELFKSSFNWIVL